MFRNCFLVFILLLTISSGYSQDTAYARYLVNVLASDPMGGRGYTINSDRKSAAFIRDEFIRHGLEPVGESFYQPVVFGVNSITEVSIFDVDGVSLTPGSDFFFSARSKGRTATYKLVWLDHSTAKCKRKMKRFERRDFSNDLIVLDPRIVDDKGMRDFFLSLFWMNNNKGYFRMNHEGIVILKDKPGWQISDSGKEADYIVLTVRTGCITKESREVTVSFASKYEPAYKSNNVIGMVRGTEYPDSFIVFTAHYDHLGMMGKTIIPGANDNASGTAMITDLARHYAANPPKWSVAFMAFTGEEAGLIGATHYTSEPLFPLENIRLLINLDMVGTGSEGITMVNGSFYPDDFALLDSLNRVYEFLPEVKIRGESANSDHHPFHARGVKAFFIYTMGKEFSEYHNIYDKPEDLPLTKYREVFTLLTRFAGEYMK